MNRTTKKLFGRDMGMRSTFCKYDPCVVGERPTISCEDCMVSLISDRFLGEKFAKEVLSKKYDKTKDLFTYVLIADTIGCNLNCWFCYAWKYLDLEDARSCMPHFLSAVELAKQFDCKIRKAADLEYLKKQVKFKNFLSDKEKKSTLNHLRKELPFSRIRISGGEPLFSSSQFFQSEISSSNLIEQTIKYWIDFFEELDKLVGRIKKEKLINIVTIDSEWQTLKHPVWLTEVKDKIMVRFDTNGIILGNEKMANLFYSELFRLFKNDKLKNIHIQIDFSFKGATAKEFWWSQSRNLPTTIENNDQEIDVKRHPQVKGYINMINNINKFAKPNPEFKNCVSITVEKGIDHDWNKSKLWLYYPHAMNWDKLAKELNFEFSDVVNCFDLNFGWNLNAKIHRYTKRGAMIELSTGSQKIDVTFVPVLELMEFRRQNLKRKDYMTLVYPTGREIEIFKQKKIKPLKLPGISLSEQSFWIITGSTENLKIGVDHGLWGIKKDFEGLWKSLKKDDLLFFYCSYPISGIVGYGKVTNTQANSKPFWPNENPTKESKYPLRIKFHPEYIVENWSKDRKSLRGTGINYYHGLNYIELEEKTIILKKLKKSKN